ncbi:MAG: hypothetical protein ABIS18_04725 [Actinomycetota bacterium]
MNRRRLLIPILVGAVLCSLPLAIAETGSFERVSVTSTGTEGNNLYAELPSISGDGRFIAFQSASTHLHPADDSIRPDVYRFDRVTRKLDLVSVDADGVHRDGSCGFDFGIGPSISGNGNVIAFGCFGSMGTEDSNGRPDIFVRNLSEGTTTWVSSFEGDAYESAISSDGRFVAFRQGIPGTPVLGVYRYDLALGSLTLVSVGWNAEAPNASSETPSISADGRFIAFESDATNLLSTIDESSPIDNLVECPPRCDRLESVFVRDLLLGTTSLASIDANGARAEGYGPVLSGDGTKVAFESMDPLVSRDLNQGGDIYVRDLSSATTTLASEKVRSLVGVRDPRGCCDRPSISSNGRFVSFTSSVLWPPPPFGYIQPNPLDPYVYVYDMDTERLVVASITPQGTRFAARWSALSSDGRFLALASADDVAPGDSNGRLDIYVMDRSPTLGTCANGANETGFISRRLHNGFETPTLHDLSCEEIVGSGF